MFLVSIAFAQSIEARRYFENEDSGAAPTVMAALYMWLSNNIRQLIIDWTYL